MSLPGNAGDSSTRQTGGRSVIVVEKRKEEEARGEEREKGRRRQKQKQKKRSPTGAKRCGVARKEKFRV